MDGENRIIRDDQVLEEVFIPSRIVHRDGQLKALRDSLNPITRGQSPRDSFLWGRPGTGKTCIARHVTESLDADARVSYVNCWEAPSRFNILYSILKDLGLQLSVHRKGTPIDELLLLLRKTLEKQRLVAILDEIDKLQDEKIFYDLANTQNLCLVLIANTETALHGLDPRTRSRLASAENIEFPEYSGQEISDILKDRAEWGLVPGAVKGQQLEAIARKSSGDARIAIGLLRAAAQKAEAQDIASITDNILRDVLSGAKPLAPGLEKLSTHQRTLLELLRTRKSMGPANLYREFLAALKKRGLEPVVDRTFRKHLEALMKKRFVKSSGEGRWRVYTAEP